MSYLTRKHPIYDILDDMKGLYLSYQSAQGGTLSMISYVPIRYPIFDITVDGRDPIYKIIWDSKGPNFLYQSLQGGTLYKIS